MANESRCARITGPVPYVNGGGRTQHIPLGPCLIENMGDRLVDVIWGKRGQTSVAIPIEAIEAARTQGHLEFIPGSPPG